MFYFGMLLNFVVMFIGELNPEIYKSINNFYNGSQRFVSSGSTISSIVINERNSGIFSQPSNAGMFLSVSITCLLYERSYLSKFLILPVLYFGFATKSSVFIMSIMIILLIYFMPNIFFRTRYLLGICLTAPLILIGVITSLFLANPDMFILYFIGGGRFVSESNFMMAFITMGFYDFLFGIDLTLLKKGLGDSSVITKIFLGGISMYVFYVFFLWLYLKRILSIGFVNYKLFYTITLILSLGELGFNSYSQPGFYNLVLFPLFWREKSNVQR